VKPWLEAEGVWDQAYLGDRHAWFFAVLDLLKPRAKKLEDFLTVGRFFFTDLVEYDRDAVARHLEDRAMIGHLAAVDKALARLAAFDTASIEEALRATADARGIRAPALIHAVRVAVTGKAASPGLFEVVSLIGRERTHARLLAAAALNSAPPA
jgi:glutamyl-tRNA synthetase